MTHTLGAVAAIYSRHHLRQIAATPENLWLRSNSEWKS